MWELGLAFLVQRTWFHRLPFITPRLPSTMSLRRFMSNRRRLLLRRAITMIGEPVPGNNSSGEKGAGASVNGASISGSGVAGMRMKMIEPNANASAELQP